MIEHLGLPVRTTSPRKNGLTVLMDSGTPTKLFEDTMTSHSDLIDLLKFGWGTSLVTKDIQRKIDCLESLGIDYFFGGTLFEKFYHKQKVDDYRQYCKDLGCRYIEISDGTIEIPDETKNEIIGSFAEDFTVLSEVGEKDEANSRNMFPRMWIDKIKGEINAGAAYVLTEARETGNSGICRADGEVRFGLIEELAADPEINTSQIIFEAPRKDLQLYFIERFGTNVNLANIALNDVIGLETLRLGLRFDSFMLFE